MIQGFNYCLFTLEVVVQVQVEILICMWAFPVYRSGNTTILVPGVKDIKDRKFPCPLQGL